MGDVVLIIYLTMFPLTQTAHYLTSTLVVLLFVPALLSITMPSSYLGSFTSAGRVTIKPLLRP
jgi:hypothetical protein